jgi:hypothetical protein
MILERRSAASFINAYGQLLREICGPAGNDVKLLERPFEGQKDLMSDASLLVEALSRIHAQAQSIDLAVVAAAVSIQVNF